MSVNGNMGQFVRAHSGMVAAFALLAAGFMAALWASGIIGLPDRVALIESQRLAADAELLVRINEIDKRGRISEERLIWVICTSIPPNTRNELRALRVDCGDVDAIMRNLQ